MGEKRRLREVSREKRAQEEAVGLRVGAESLGRDDQAAKAERERMHEDVYPHNEHTVIKQYTLIGKKNGGK